MQEDKEKQPDSVVPIDRELTPEEERELEESVKRHPASSVNSPKNRNAPKKPDPDSPDAA